MWAPESRRRLDTSAHAAPCMNSAARSYGTSLVILEKLGQILGIIVPRYHSLGRDSIEWVARTCAPNWDRIGQKIGRPRRVACDLCTRLPLSWARWCLGPSRRSGWASEPIRSPPVSHRFILCLFERLHKFSGAVGAAPLDRTGLKGQPPADRTIQRFSTLSPDRLQETESFVHPRRDARPND